MLDFFDPLPTDDDYPAAISPSGDAMRVYLSLRVGTVHGGLLVNDLMSLVAFGNWYSIDNIVFCTVSELKKAMCKIAFYGSKAYLVGHTPS